VDSGTEGDRLRKQEFFRRRAWAELNEEIRAAASKLDAAEQSMSWEFRCECGATDCEAMVALTSVEFDALKAREEPALATGHTVSRASVAHRKSRRSANDASALRAPAVQQQRRARKRTDGRVLLVDDSEAMRTAAAGVVSTAQELRLVGTAASGEEAIQRVSELKPDFVLLDVRMPGMDGIDAAQIIREENPEVVVVLYSADPPALDRATRSVEAAAFIDKGDLRPHTLDTLWLVHRPRE
jgi:CheY-like chemotaxis protein